MKGLAYLDYGISECSKTNDCRCDYCQSCEFALLLMARLLEVAMQNGSFQHYNLLVVNCDYLFTKAKEALESQKEKMVH